MHIELYSVKGFTGSALKQMLEEELGKHQLAFKVTEINHVDQFIRAELASVPAFKIGRKIIAHKDKATVEDTVKDVMDYILDKCLMSILVPVDFTEESMHAVAYANVIAGKLSLGLTLVYIHKPIYDPLSAGALDVQFLHNSNKRLIELVDAYNADNAANGIAVRFSAHLEVGEPSTSLIELFDEGKYEIMVIGTKGVDNTFRRLFGTVSSAVSRKSKRPVIVVPAGSEIKFPGKIVVGFTEELMLDRALEDILDFGTRNNVFFDFIHVTDDNDAFDTLKNKLYERLVVHRDLDCGFNIRPVFDTSEHIDETLFSYAHEVGAQMVALVTHPRSFAESLMHTSVTKNALAHPEVPVMIFHQDG
jgi:nucleotide-binding universal stress UspA family protein